MTIALREREHSKRPARASMLPPPLLPPHKRTVSGMGDDDPAFLRWMEEQEQKWNEEESGETPFGCDYSDGALASTGCRW